VHFVQQFRQALDLVNYDNAIGRCKLLSHAPWILAESEVDGVIQKIVDARVLQRVLNEKRLASLPRPQQKMGFFLQKSRQIQHAFNRLSGLRPSFV
jgi:hypothetical protein